MPNTWEWKYRISDAQKTFLRKLEKTINFGFIYDKVKDSYSNTGEPLVVPVLIVKMLLIGYLYGMKTGAINQNKYRI